MVILTEELWRSRFGGNPSIVNTTIILDDVSRTVVGILPRGAWLFREDQFFVPLVLTPGTPRAARSPHWAVVFGRLKPGDDDRARRCGVEEHQAAAGEGIPAVQGEVERRHAQPAGTGRGHEPSVAADSARRRLARAADRLRERRQPAARAIAAATAGDRAARRARRHRRPHRPSGPDREHRPRRARRRRRPRARVLERAPAAVLHRADRARRAGAGARRARAGVLAGAHGRDRSRLRHSPGAARAHGPISTTR